MIEEVIVYRCKRCESTDFHPNGHAPDGQQRYHCKQCHYYGYIRFQQGGGAEASSESSPQHRQDLVLKNSLERTSFRGLQRLHGVCFKTVIRWIEEKVKGLPPLARSVSPGRMEDVVELDEVWNFIGNKDNKIWLWTAICRRTREIIAWVVGDRSAETCRRLWESIPDSYRRSWFYSDGWEAYQTVFPPDRHEAVGKETGETDHMERWNNTLRQRLGRYVRKTLSFPRKLENLKNHLGLFVNDYNKTLSPIM